MTGLKSIALVAMLGGASLLSACASMSESECVAADWNAVGFEDGVQGRSADHIARHRKACAAHGVTPNFLAYSDGREEGLQTYCREPNGLQVGIRGGAYANVCPEDSDGVFSAAYQAGRQLYQYNRKVAAQQATIRSHRSDLEDIIHEIEETQWEIVEGDMTDLARMKLVIKVVELSKAEDDLEKEIKYLQQDLVELEQQRDYYRTDLYDQYGVVS